MPKELKRYALRQLIDFPNHAGAVVVDLTLFVQSSVITFRSYGSPVPFASLGMEVGSGFDC